MFESLKIHAEVGPHVCVPIHAYPAMIAPGKSPLPKTLNFDGLVVGQPFEKVLTIPNPSNVKFEFEAVMDLRHEWVNVEPASGVIPPESEAKLTLLICANKQSSFEAHLKVHISQFGTDPFTVVLTGRARAPGYNENRAKDSF